jgi:hypothetical protein
MVPIVQLKPDKSSLTDRDPLWITLVVIEFELNGVRHSIQPGFVTNLGTVPKLVRNMVDVSDESMIGFVIHDFLYAKNNRQFVSRKDADEALYQISLMCEQDRLEAGITWIGVRLGSWIKFAKHPAKFIPISKELLQKICDDNKFIPNLPANFKLEN